MSLGPKQALPPPNVHWSSRCVSDRLGGVDVKACFSLLRFPATSVMTDQFSLIESGEVNTAWPSYVRCTWVALL